MGAVAWDAILGAVTISQIESSGLSNNATQSQGFSSGSTVADALYLDHAEPSFSLTSSDLYTILDEIDLSTGLCLSSTTISLPYGKQGCAGDLGDGNHTVISGTTGFATIQSISATSDGKAATASVECCLLSTNGSTIPITSVSNGNLAATSMVNTYRMAKVTAGGSAVSGLTAVTINPGVAYTKRSTDIGIYPTHTYIDRVMPTIDLTFENEAALASFGPLYGDLSALIVYLQKKADGGTVVAAATTGHIAISCGDALSIVDTFRGQGRNPAEVSVKIQAKQLAVSLASAVP